MGSVSILFLFMPLSTISLFLLKLVTSIFMIFASFGYKDKNYFKKNFIYLYIISIMLGGILYFLDITFSYENKGLIFLNNGLSINFIFLLIIGPILLYYYVKEQLNYKRNYTLMHKVEIVLDKKKYVYTGYLDTGNKLEDPYKKRAILLIYDKKLKFSYDDSILVPYKTLEGGGILKCRKIDSLKIDDEEVKQKILVGKSKDKFNIEGVDCILPNKIKEELL